MAMLDQSAPAGVEPTRMRLIRVATRLFQQRGYHGVGVASILEVANLPKGSLYHHFPGGKEELALAAVQALDQQIEAEFAQLRRQGLNARAICCVVAAGIAAWSDGTGHSQGSLLASLAIGLGPGDDLLAETLIWAHQRSIKRLTDLFEQDGIHNAPDQAQAFAVMLEGAMILAKICRDGSLVEDATSRFLSQL